MALKTRLQRGVLAAGFVLGATAVALAQVTTGSMSGTVKDAQGGVVPGATVTLISESQSTKSTPVVTDATGDFVFVNLRADTYTIEVTMPSFRTMRRSGVPVSPGQRVSLGALVIELGGTTEVVEVKAEAPVVQASSGERSFAVDTAAVQNLPIQGRSFTQLAALAPGVTGTSRIGDRASTGGGDTNVQMDGVSTMDTGSNRAIIDLNIESIAEVKVLVSNYQAEFGRSSGLQITAVTKSGTNRFRGSLYDVERNSDWNSNSRTNILNGDPKPVLRQREWGYSIGGPVGKPGGANKLFFFYTQEFEPRTGGNDVVRFRVPTALERQGDYSQSTDNNGNLYPYIKNPAVSGTCSATSQAACFADGGVLGRIPANQLYQTGVNILKMWPLPNLAPGQPYNFEITRPSESILSYQPAMRFDYQPTSKIRASFKYSGFTQREQIEQGSIPGWNDTKMVTPHVSLIASTVNYTLSPTLFLEGTAGHSAAYQGGCFGVGSGGGPQFCNAFTMTPNANRNNIGLGDIPFIFPDANVIDSRYFVYSLLNRSGSPMWDGTRVLLPPSFSWGSRVSNSSPNYAPPSIGFPSQNTASSLDVSISLTKVLGRHTMKTGFYNQYSNKQQVQGGAAGGPSVNFQQDTVGTNPCDTSFGFANAATGCFSSYSQGSKGVEGKYIYYNVEGYVQDNWKLNARTTVDYGVRLVHQTPQYDALGQASNFFVDKWNRSAAPVLYVAGCANGVYPCTGTNRQAMNPSTGQFLGPNSTLAIGTIVPNSGDLTNGLIQAGKGIPISTYLQPALGVAPRFGMAYDLSGRQRLVLRGGAGLFFDRPSGNAVFTQVLNPPARRSVTLRFGQLQTLGTGGLATEAPSSLSVYEYDSPLPSSTQWNVGVQIALPWSSLLDVEYTGQHGFNIVEGINLNAVDFNTAYLPEYQDRTLAPTTPGATAVSTDLMRAFSGYSSITQNVSRGWNTYHSLQLSFTRRFRNGMSWGFNDTIGLSSTGSTAARLQHNPDGTVTYRADQAQANNLLQVDPVRHTMKGNFVWDLPDLTSSRPTLRAVGYLVNDWQLSGIWTASTSAPYSVGFSYQSGGANNVNLTGSPDYGARIRIVGDPGAGCSSDPYRQFNSAAFQGPLAGSVGLESGAGYLHGCFASALDLAIARNIRLPRGRTIQLRADLFNAPNAAGITARNTTLALTNPTDPITNAAPVFDPVTGNLNNGVNLTSTGARSTDRSRPKNAGFGVATGYQSPRNVQLQVRFSF
jgi:Carboxypeptidase regulatory-like domain